MVAVGKSRGGVMLVEKQEWFVRLIAQGVSNAEACRIVGVNRRTGTRWRYGRTILNTAGEPVHYLPVRYTAPKAPHPRYLSLAERTMIADLHRAGVSVRGIAEELGRAPSTVSRELRRNVDSPGRYLPATAQRLSTERRSRSVPRDASCATNRSMVWSPRCWASGGAPNKSATNYGRTFLINPSATCVRSRSIRRSTIHGPIDPPGQTAAPAAPTSGPGPGATGSAHQHDDDRRAARRGRRTGTGRALGG